MTVEKKNNLFGYLVAAGGFVMVMITMALLVAKTLELTWLVLALVAAGIFLVALGMYVVYPKETREYLDAAGDAVDHIPVPRFQRVADQHPEPAVVKPAPDQTVIVQPSTAPEPAPAVEPELRTEGEVAPLVGRRNPYPHGDG